MKKQIKQISIIVWGLFICACSNTNTSNIALNNQRESFSNTTVAKLFKKYDFYKIPEKEQISKNEYATIEELLKNLYPNRWEKVIENSKEDIEEAEKISKTKFFLYKDSRSERIYFATGNSIGDFAVMYIGSNFVAPAEKNSIKDFIAKSSLFVLHDCIRENVDVSSFGFDKNTTEKLLEAQNYKGL